jgi:secretory phospholipase A2
MVTSHARAARRGFGLEAQAAAPATCAGGPVVRGVLALQPTAGNRAVTELLGRAVQRACDCGCECGGACAPAVEAQVPVEVASAGPMATVQRACSGGKKWDKEYDGCSLPAKYALSAGAVSLGLGGSALGAILSYLPHASGQPGRDPGLRFMAGAGAHERLGLAGVGGIGFQGEGFDVGAYGGYGPKPGAFAGWGASRTSGRTRVAAGADWSQREGAGGGIGVFGGKDWWRLGAEGRVSQRGGYSAMVGASFTFDMFGGSGAAVTHSKSREAIESRGARDSKIPDIRMPGTGGLPGAAPGSVNLAGPAKDNPTSSTNPAGGPDTTFAKRIPTEIGGVACDRHDECYQTCGSDRAQCDHQMLLDMQEICARSSGGGDLKVACYRYAQIYYGGLKTFGASAHKNRQDAVCVCEGKKEARAVYPPVYLLRALAGGRDPTWPEYTNLATRTELTAYKRFVNGRELGSYLAGAKLPKMSLSMR